MTDDEVGAGTTVIVMAVRGREHESIHDLVVRCVGAQAEGPSRKIIGAWILDDDLSVTLQPCAGRVTYTLRMDGVSIEGVGQLEPLL